MKTEGFDAHQSDRELVQRMLGGEEEAFQQFFDLHFPGLYRFALGRLGHDPDAAEEVAQAALSKVVRKLHTYRGEASLFTWVCTFCRWEISAWHAQRSRRGMPVELVEESAEVRAALESL
jgi:RNA polymerase sigma-70 factor (ECF subfamily)